MKTFTLEVAFDCDFDLFGLVSSSRDYTLAWTLNRTLRLRLIRQPDLVVDLLSQGRLLFSHYLHVTETLTFRLLRNRSLTSSALKKPFLAPDYKQYDYLLHITNGQGSLAADELLPTLAVLPAVQYAGPVEVEGLKYKENFQF
ncbi:IPExxxVDY family protein [uncultured Hymenobacter sp.]|uniref:IPExxxVDY family protein n=1 Tax=uncultured Hymenobacter sp. TaxID=170016 RepID=UPI0035CA5756